MAKFDGHFLTDDKDDDNDLRDLDLSREAAEEINGSDDADTMRRTDYDAGSDQELADYAPELADDERQESLQKSLIEAVREEEDGPRAEAARNSRRGDPNSAVQGTSERGQLKHSDRDPLNKEDA